MRLVIFFVIWAFIVPALTTVQYPPTIKLPVTYRDFTPDHPDFQCCNEGEEKQIVKDTLGEDGTPVFNSPPECKTKSNSKCGRTSNGHTTHGSANFYDWYHNTKSLGTNGAYNRTLELKLVNATLGAYDFTNFEFFPLNDLGPSYPNSTRIITGKPRFFENEDYSYNYLLNTKNFHFTTEIHTQFVYKTGAVFTFFGDDDVWVFINKKLALDLGGVHKLLQGEILLDKLNLTVNKTYQLDIFHAERFTSHSNFKITTTMCLDPCPGGACRHNETRCEDRKHESPCYEYKCAKLMDPLSDEDCVEVLKKKLPVECTSK